MAMKDYDAILRDAEEDSEAHFLRGRALARLSRWVEACYDLKRALDLGFGDATLAAELANAEVGCSIAALVSYSGG